MTEFRDTVVRTSQRGGKVIVPSFAVGRTQEIVYSLNRMVTEGSVPHLPVYVDSPLAVNATEIFTHHREYFDEETHAFIREGKHPALDFPGLAVHPFGGRVESDQRPQRTMHHPFGFGHG